MLVVLGTARRNGKTAEAIRHVFDKYDHELVDLGQKSISPYDYDGGYPKNDDFIAIAESMAKHKQIVLATPIYWYAMSGLMKIFFDRLTDLITFHKPVGRALARRACYVLATGTDEALPEGFEVPFRRTSAYFDMTYGGATYVYTGGDNVGHSWTLAEAKQFFAEAFSALNQRSV